MTCLVPIICLFSTNLVPFQQATKTLTAKDIYEKYSKSVVQIVTESSRGTGFFDSKGDLYTAYHVIEGSKSVSVKFSDGKEVRALWVKDVDIANDIAILLTEAYQGWQQRELGPKLGDYASSKVGETILVIGSPLGLEGTLTEGMVSAKRTIKSGNILQLSAAVDHGSSGSPVLNLMGDVIGMVTSGVEGSQGLNFAVSSKELKGVNGVPISILGSGGSAKSTENRPNTNTTSILANPTIGTLPVEISVLEKLGPIRVLVEDLPSSIKVSFSESSVEGWVKEALERSGMTSIESTKQTEAFRNDKGTTEIEVLRRNDLLSTLLYVRVGAMENSLGTTFYKIEVAVQRGVFIFPGRYESAKVWDTGTYGLFGASLSKYAEIRDGVMAQVKIFADAYKAANAGKAH